MKKKLVSAFLCAAMVTTMLAGCGSSDNKGTEAGANDKTPESETTKQTVAGDPSKEDAFVVWGWNEDIKKILDSCFATENKDDYARIVFVNSGGSDYYQTQIDPVLQDKGNQLYPDLMGLEIDYVQKYVQSGQLLSMKDLGITESDLKNQYTWIRQVCSTESEPTADNQYASFWQSTPGGWALRADLCQEYLGTTDPAALQEMFSTWDKVEETAKIVSDKGNGSCKLLSGWDDLMRVYSNNRKVGWSKDDTITIDPQIKAYFEEAKKFADNDWTFNTTQWKDDWTAMMAGTGKDGSKAALAYTGCPWFQYWSLNHDVWAGQTITIPGPMSYFWGGTGLAVPEACSDKELAAKIIKYFTCDKTSMQTIAKFNCDFINNKEANKELLADSENIKTEKGTLANGNGLMNSQNYIQVFSDILDNMTVDASFVTAEDKTIGDNLRTYVQEYIDGKSYEEAEQDLINYIHDTYSYLNLPE